MGSESFQQAEVRLHMGTASSSSDITGLDSQVIVSCHGDRHVQVFLVL